MRRGTLDEVASAGTVTVHAALEAVGDALAEGGGASACEPACAAAAPGWGRSVSARAKQGRAGPSATLRSAQGQKAQKRRVKMDTSETAPSSEPQRHRDTERTGERAILLSSLCLCVSVVHP